MPPKQLGVSEIDVRNTIRANYLFRCICRIVFKIYKKA